MPTTTTKPTRRRKAHTLEIQAVTLHVPIQTNLFNTREAARYLRSQTGVGSADFLASARSYRSGLPGPDFVKIGVQIFYAQDALDRWISAHRDELRSPMWQRRATRPGEALSGTTRQQNA